MRRILFLLTIACTSQLFAQSNNNVVVYEPVPASVTGSVDAAAPSDAIVLFDGSNMDAWHTTDGEEPARWDIDADTMTVAPGTGNLKTKQLFGDIQLHVEWRPTDVIQGNGQGRGNSGVFLHSLYEVQILDSWNNPTYVNGQAGSLFKQYAPLVNASKPPGEWQSFDIVFAAPVFSKAGVLESPAYATVIHNGVLVLNHVEILGSTFTPEPEYAVRCTPYSQKRMQNCSAKMPITIQDHGHLVSYRNMWVREL